MQTDINFIGCPDKLVGQAWPAAGAEDNSGLLKGLVNFLIPPAGVPEFDDIATRGIELAHNRVQPRLCVTVARRQLKQEAAHPLAQNIGEEAKIPNERLGALE